MKIKFNSDKDLSLIKTIEIYIVTIVVKTSCYSLVLLDQCLYELKIIEKCYIMIELTFLKKFMLIKQANQKVRYFSLLALFKKVIYFSIKCIHWM